MNFNHICKELRECKLDDEALMEKKRQLLRANNHQLRQLERQLQFAVVSKELREQQEYRTQKKEEDFRKQNEENAKFALECEMYRKSKLEEDEQEKQKKRGMIEILKNQINDLQQKRRTEFEKIKEDCDGMEKLKNQFLADKTAKLKETEVLRKKYKSEMEEALLNKKKRLQFEQERNKKEHECNLAYQKECDDLKSQMVEESKRIKKEKEALNEQIGQQLATVNQEKEKRQNLFLSLSIEERKAKDDESYKNALVKRLNERESFRIDLEIFHIKNKYLKECQFKEEERKFREEQLLYLQERDKLDQLSDEKRRRKKMEHSKTLKEMIEIRRYQRATTIAARIAEFNKLMKDAQESDQLIEEERYRMLSAVPKEILRYLPPGVLKYSEIEFVNSLAKMS